jgi:hypothetical protein
MKFINRGLEQYQKCAEDHKPNLVTKKAIENVKNRKNLKTAATVEELFKKLGK